MLDQFEEYFLYHPDEDGDGTFALELPRAVMRENLRASFLVSIREDAYTQLDRFEGRIRNLFGSNFRLEHLDEPAARRAIEGPVERYNELLPNGDGRYAVEPELVDDVLDQVRAGTIALGQAGAGTVETNGHGDLRVDHPFPAARPDPAVGGGAPVGFAHAERRHARAARRRRAARPQPPRRRPGGARRSTRATSRPPSSTSW